MGDRQHTQIIQINTVIDENEKLVFYFIEKTKWIFFANPVQYVDNLLITSNTYEDCLLNTITVLNH